MGNKHRFSVDEIAKALTESGAVISGAARRLGCDWHTVDNYIKKHPKLQDVQREAHETSLDYTEVTLDRLGRGYTACRFCESPLSNVQALSNCPVCNSALTKGDVRQVKHVPPNPAAVFFRLKCLAKARGYIEKVEHDMRGDMTYSIKLPADWPTEDYDDPDINPDSPTKPPEKTNGCNGSV